MRPLIIGPEQRARILAVREFATNPANLNILTEVVEGVRPPPGDNPNHVAHFEVGFRVVYSIDQEESGLRWKHLSVSVADAQPGHSPHPSAVQMICGEFGIDCTESECRLAVDEEHGIVHVIEPFSTFG